MRLPKPCLFALIFVLSTSVVAQQTPATSEQTSSPAPQQSGPVQPHTLLDGTPVKLRLSETISSAEAKTNQEIPFEVVEEVKVDDVVVLPKGATAMGTVTEADHKKSMGRAGKLNIAIKYARLADNEKAALRATKDTKGGGHVGAMTGAMVATAIVFFPAAPLFLLIKGKDITIPKGTEITAYINGDVPLDATKFDPTATPLATGAGPSLSSVDIKSTPDGADITVDERFMGNTPSSLRLPAGDHKIKLEKAGFKPWEKTLTVVSGEAANVNASLEQ